MGKWKRIVFGIFILSNLASAVEKTQTIDIEINNQNNPTKLEKEALLGARGDKLTNTAEITVNGDDPDSNANLAGLRGIGSVIINDEHGKIKLDSIEGGTGISSTYSTGPLSPTEGNDAEITNKGEIEISGKEVIGIAGHGGNTGAGVILLNSETGVIEIKDGSILASGMTLKGGVSENRGIINVHGYSKNIGMEVLYNEHVDSVQKNSGIINLIGSTITAMDDAEEIGIIRTAMRTTSINTQDGKILGNGNSLRGIISSKGGQVENHGLIELTGAINYGISSENKVVVGTKIAGSVINTGTITINGNQGIGAIGINVKEVSNQGDIIINGNQGTGIKYYNLDSGGLTNTGQIILNGIENWAFATDEEKSNNIESVGEILIQDGSRDSGAFKVSGIITNGENKANVLAVNGILNKIIYVEDKTNSGGVVVPNRASVENSGSIRIEGGQQNFAIHSKNGARVTNSNEIIMNDINGVAIYNPNGDFIINTGTIELDGTNQIGIYYENENIGVTNTGQLIIKGEGGIAFDVNDGDFQNGRTDLYASNVGNTEVKVSGNVLIDQSARSSIGAYARNTVKRAINDGSIIIKGEGSSGLLGLDQTTLINNGNINVETKESYGIQALRDATVINNGRVSNSDEDGVAIYMGREDSNLYMDEAAGIVGRVVSNGGVGRFFGKDEFSGAGFHEIDYSLEGFSHLDIESGEFKISTDVVLEDPTRNILAQNHENTGSYTGNLEIEADKSLTMELSVNRNGLEGDRYTSTVHANSLEIKGTLNYRPLDRVYVVADDVEEIIVPNVYTNEEILGADKDHIKVLNYVPGWEGSYLLSRDKTDLSMVLRRRKGGQYLPDSYQNGIWNYPHNFLSKKFVLESSQLDDKFKIIEKIHNAEIPYYLNTNIIGKSGNYVAGPKKGYFYYDTYGAQIENYYKMKENLIVGLGFTGLESKLKYKYDSNEKLNSYILNSNISYQMNDLKIGSYLGASLNKHKLSREIVGKGISVTSNYESYAFNLGLAGEYRYRVSRDSLFRTYADIGYIINYIEGYKEKGHEDYIMELPSLTEFIPNIKIGTKWEHRSKNRFTELGLNLNYKNNGKVENRRGFYSFNKKAVYDIYSVKMPKFIIGLNLKQELDINDRFSIYGLLSAEIGEKFWQASGKVGGTYEF